MVTPLGFGLANAGLGALSAFTGQKAANKERRRFKRTLRRRRESPFGRALTAAAPVFQDLALNAPGRIRSDLRGRAAAEAQGSLGDLNRQLAGSGFTAGSDVAQRGQRGLLNQLNRQRTGIETDTSQLQASLLGSLGNFSTQAGNFLNPLATGPEETFIDPAQILQQGLLGFGLGQEFKNRDRGGAGQNLNSGFGGDFSGFDVFPADSFGSPGQPFGSFGNPGGLGTIGQFGLGDTDPFDPVILSGGGPRR